MRTDRTGFDFKRFHFDVQDIQEERENQESLHKKKSIVTLPLEKVVESLKPESLKGETHILPIPIEEMAAEKEAFPQSKEIATEISVFFDYDDNRIKKLEEEKLFKMLSDIQHADVPAVEIKGYTDKNGTQKHNDELAMKRAQAVADFLVAHGFDRARITIEAHGKCCYVSEDDAQNRRVELKTGKLPARAK